jgi:hypothetical protein
MATPKNLLKYSVSQRSINDFEGKIISQNLLERKSLILKGTQTILQFLKNIRNLSNISIFLSFFQISVCKACGEVFGYNSSPIV